MSETPATIGPDAARCWEPAGDAKMNDLRWTASKYEAVVWDRRSGETWLRSTLALDLGETR